MAQANEAKTQQDKIRIAADALAEAAKSLEFEARYHWEKAQAGERALISAKAIGDVEKTLRQYREAKEKYGD